jgi:hypothetical protein
MLRNRPTTSAFLIALVIHLIGIIILGLTIKTTYKEMAGSWIELVDTSNFRPRPVRRPLTKTIKPKFELQRELENKNIPKLSVESSNVISEVMAKGPNIITRSVEIRVQKDPGSVLHKLDTAAQVPTSLGDVSISPAGGTPKGLKIGKGFQTGRVRAAGRSDRLGLSIVNSVGEDELGGELSGDFAKLYYIPEGKLGAVLVGKGKDVMGFIRIVRLKHRMADWWQDPTALASFIDWLEEHTRLKADMRIEGGALELTDPRILDAPLVIMTGHDEDVVLNHNMDRDGQIVGLRPQGPKFPLAQEFTPEERAALRKYLIDRQGTLFFDDCGFNGLFAGRVREELRRALPEYPLQRIERNDELYSIYYTMPGPPTGGDIFWGSENNPHASQFPYQWGVKIGRRWAVIYNRKDYLCSMETLEIPSRTLLRLRRSTEVHKFMTNLLFYAMKYGGNVDRSQYKP